MQIIPNEIQGKLREIGKSINKSQWEIGDLGIEVLESVYDREIADTETAPTMTDIWNAVAELVGLGSRRVSKIVAVSTSFPKSVRTNWAFGYYERILPLDEENRERAIGFLDFFLVEYGRTLKVGEFMSLYRQHILGETIEPDPPKNFSEIDPWEGLKDYLEKIDKLVEHRTESEIVQFGIDVKTMIAMLPIAESAYSSIPIMIPSVAMVE